jgi:hypothetical protein
LWEDKVDRRTFLIVAGGLAAFTACAKAPPLPSPTPSATDAEQPQILFWSGSTPIEESVRAVLAEASAAMGFAPTQSDIQTADVNGMLFDLAANPNAVALGFATTLLQDLRSGQEQPTPDEILKELATAIQDSAALLGTSPLDGRIVWVVNPDSKLKSLADLQQWSAEKTKPVAVPTFVGPRPDGIPSLTVVYAANVEAKYIDDPLARRESLTRKDVEVAAFRACDFSELEGLRVLEDPTGITLDDPMVIMLNHDLPDSQPQAVLAFTDAWKAITPENFASLEAQFATGAAPAEAAKQWLSEH